METGILREISPLGEHDFMYVALFSILYVLSKFDDARELASSSFAKVEVNSDSKRILKVKNYIDQHYKDEMSLEQVDTTDSVSEICRTTGFNTLSNFNRLFRKRKGCNPTEFREKYQKTKVIV